MRIISQLLFLACAQGLFAQNLVVNPSFEDGAVCDGTTERVDTVNGWSPIAGNPGYINPNCPLSKESKSFVQGMRLPPAGHGSFLAIQRFDVEGEFLQGRLVSTLEAGQQYVVKMRVRLPIQFCNIPINEVGILFSATPLDVTKERRKIDLPSLALQNNTQTAITQQYQWEEVSALYEAKGDELYLAIGNFANNNKGIFEARTNKKDCTYLFMDMISVSKFQAIELPVYDPKMSLKKDERLLLKEVEFEEGSDVLKKSSFDLLKNLAKTLLENPKMKIEIASYSDNSLDESESITFTKARARAIAKFLEEQEVLSSQIQELGKGSADAVALNNTVASRKKNERIEIRFVEL